MRRIQLEALNEGKREIIDEMVSEDLCRARRQPLASRQIVRGSRASLRPSRTAYPDLQYTVDPGGAS